MIGNGVSPPWAIPANPIPAVVRRKVRRFMPAFSLRPLSSSMICWSSDGSAQDLGQRSRELVDVRVSAERPWTDANRAFGKCLYGAVNIRGAVKAGPDGNVEGLVENPAQLGR